MKEPQEPILNILALMTKLMIFTGILHLLNLELEGQLTMHIKKLEIIRLQEKKQFP